MHMNEMYQLADDGRPLDRVLAEASDELRRVLDKSLAKRELSLEDGLTLLKAEGSDLTALVRTADAVRAEDVGPVVTYVVNRNINFTNICFVGCQFCAFARHRKDADARTDTREELLAKVQEAIDRGASEICMQGGINAEMESMGYRDLLVAIKERFPQIHIHAFSPMEIFYGSRRAGMGYREYIAMLRDVGLGTIPGTAAEILDDDVREILSHKKVDVQAWIEIITTAHELGIRTSSTIMYGHLETPVHVVQHIEILRSIQRRTGGFTEFVPLRFIHTNTELYRKGLVGEPPPKGIVDMRMYAFSRLMLRGLIDNLQTSWVKLGTDLAKLTLVAGCNDFGGTLMEEQISKSAGADAGEFLPVDDIRDLIKQMGRIPAERNTTYTAIRPEEDDYDTGGGGWRSTTLGRAAEPARAG